MLTPKMNIMILEVKTIYYQFCERIQTVPILFGFKGTLDKYSIYLLYN